MRSRLRLCSAWKLSSTFYSVLLFNLTACLIPLPSISLYLPCSPSHPLFKIRVKNKAPVPSYLMDGYDSVDMDGIQNSDSGSPGPASSVSVNVGVSVGASVGVGSHLEAGKGYTFEEQFKQLYELCDDPRRKEFLDDLFSFMQKRGKCFAAKHWLFSYCAKGLL